MSDPDPPAFLTSIRTLLPGAAAERGWRDVERHPGETWVRRHDLEGPEPTGSPARPLLSFIHLSDLHVMDAQSPARAEYLDRWADPDSPWRSHFPEIGTYRPHEMLTAQIVDAMVESANSVISSHPGQVSFAVATGDVTDNCQANELANYLALLNGGEVLPDSGEPGHYEGVASSAEADWDERYWHPEGPPPGLREDLPTARYGYPRIAGLLAAATRRFVATGLSVPWYAVHGNHDNLLQGTVAPNPALREHVTGSRRFTGVAHGADIAMAIAAGAGEVGPTSYPDMAGAPWTATTADPRRELIDLRGFVRAHFGAGRPDGHGFTPDNLDTASADWSSDLGPVRLVSLNTVNSFGGWQGSISREQFAWLEDRLAGASRRWITADGRLEHHRAEDRLVIVASHHNSETITNGYAPDGSPRVLGGEVAALMLRFPNLVLWINGHTHQHRIRPWKRAGGGALGGGFWEITTAAHVDWPQQSRLIDLESVGSGVLRIRTTVFDHAGPPCPPWDLSERSHLAGIARVLAMNIWQRRDWPDPWMRRGKPEDRNTELLVPAPFPI